MARHILLFLLALTSFVFAAPLARAEDKVEVVATIPDLADLARQIGGDRVDVLSLAKGTENVHRVALRPSGLVAVGRAELFLQVGLSLEHAFVPGLLEAARNPRLEPGKPGFVTVSDGFTALEVPGDVSRSDAADVHPMGNPHINLSPAAGRHMAERVLAGLVAVDPEGREVYEANHRRYLEALTKAEARWAKVGERLRGKKLVVYHREFTYFADAYGIEVVGEVEPKPGLPPTPSHLAGLVKVIQEHDVRAVATAGWSNDRNVRFLAERTDAAVVELPSMVGGSKRASSWIALMDELHERLAEVLDPAPKDG
ncbi:MAG: hypothetical protein GC161_09460 [Planctomycetaceae bacterium]|nr:hypothetical protein [Planctomycetaceae bacterium]